ncbi:sensor histidine kinase [Rhizobium sp. YIM 134829]|uniref:sensor histidine kinase n=1 Tax=Rhizobium sp. YIM 134829 TaxID=3390453 RepID=UPI00397D4533
MTTLTNRSLISIVAWRIVIFAMLALMLEFGIVILQYWSNDEDLAGSIIAEETERLASGIVATDDRLSFVMSPGLLERYTMREGETEGGIFVRVRTAAGAVLYSNCEEMCQRHFLPIEVNPPDLWQREIAAGKPLSVAGGRSFRMGGREIFVELAVLGDPHNFVAGVLLHELRDHLIIPMPLMFGLVAGATILSVGAALKPVTAAAKEADRIDPRAALQPLSIEGMPREVATFAGAVNRLLDRVADLIQSQKIFSTSIAHEIRTPVAVVRMELERIDDPRARKAEKDLDALTHMLEQLTSLAKLDVVDASAFRMVDLETMAGDSVASLAPYVFESGRTLEFVGESGISPIRGVPALIENTVSNLVGNAVKHTPKGTHITVRAAAPAVLEVVDDGPGFSHSPTQVLERGRTKSSDALGVGLRIVERIAELHQARLVVDSDQGRGTRVRVEFAAEEQPATKIEA